MSWVEKNRKINNRRGGAGWGRAIIGDSTVTFYVKGVNLQHILETDAPVSGCFYAVKRQGNKLAAKTDGTDSLKK